MKKLSLFIFFCMFLSIKINCTNYSIIYVHLGDSLPDYLLDSVKQTRLFNENASIFIVCCKKNIEIVSSVMNALHVHLIANEELPITDAHERFLKKIKFCGLFKFSIERFFYIEQVIKKYKLKNIFHLENDNLLYINLEDYISIFENNYKGIAATFDNDHRCIPGFVYINDCLAISKLNKFSSFITELNFSDMYILGKFRNKYPEHIDNLPIIPSSYKRYYELKNLNNEKSFFEERYSKNFNLFNSIFDAAALGQYLGGLDPINVNFQPGFINESCIFNPAKFAHEWMMDEKARKVPFIKFNNELYRINNLHIHCKNLKKFVSL